MENIIAFFCAPALAGIKASNIVTFNKDKFKNIKNTANRLNLELNKKGIYFEVLLECKKRVLLMVYRKNVLEKVLNDKNNQSFLKSFGYGKCMGLDSYISHLKERLKKDEFPHEIGIFLGYPLHDIEGYLYKDSSECILCGEWKVYKNPEEAKKLFHKFNTCRIALSKKVLCGKSLAQVF